MTEPTKGACSSGNEKDKKTLLDEDIPTDFLVSWKSMSVAEDDAMDFNFEPVTKGKKKAFNFDKLDTDFNLDSEFEKLSSFAVDMSHLDFSPPMEKSTKSKEKHDGEQVKKSFQGRKEFEKSSFTTDMPDLHFSSPEEESTKSKDKPEGVHAKKSSQRKKEFEKSSFAVDMPDLHFFSLEGEPTKSKEKLEGVHTNKLFQRNQGDFSFSFDFSELDNFPIDPQPMKECNSLSGEEARDVKPHNEDKYPDPSIQLLSNQNGAIDGSNQISCEKANIIGGNPKMLMPNREISTSIASSNTKESDLTQLSLDKPNTLRGEPNISMPDRDPSLPPPLPDPRQADVIPASPEKSKPTRTFKKLEQSHQAENAASKQSFCLQEAGPPSDQTLVGVDSTQAIVSERMEVCTENKLDDGLPEEYLCDGKTAVGLGSYDEDSLLQKSYSQCAVETNSDDFKNNEHTQGHKDSPGKVEGDLHGETSASGGPITSSDDMKVDAGNKNGALKPVSGLLYRPVEGKDEFSQVNNSKFRVVQDRTDNGGHQVLSTRHTSLVRNKIGSAPSTAVIERNDKGAYMYTDQNGRKLDGNSKLNAKEISSSSCESKRSTMDRWASRSNNDLNMMSKACHSEGTKTRPFLLGNKSLKNFRSSSSQDLDILKPKVSSMASIEKLKCNSVKGSKLPLTQLGSKMLDLSSLKILRNIRIESQSVTSRTEDSSSLQKSDRAIEPQATTRVINPLCIDIKSRPTPSSKRKISDASHASAVNFPPLKRLSPCEIRAPKEGSRRIPKDEVPGHVNLLDCSRKNVSRELMASTFDYPRAINMADLEPPLTLENDKKVEKADACSKELENICSMLKKKHEEAKELLVRAVVNNNNLLMLNNPIHEDKFRSVEKFAARLLSQEVQAGS